MFSCLQILEAFLWFVLITLLNVTLIILTLSVSRLLNLLLRLVAFLLFLNPQCLASISRWITASSSWKRFCLFVCRALSSIMVICMLTSSNLWASGYDVDGTDQTSLGQFSGRVQQTYKHSVPRFFVPEHGTMFTLALVRFPPTATKEIQYLNAKGALTYTDIAGDPVLYGNLPPREISMKDVFR